MNANWQDRPAVVIDPAMCSGEPCIMGRRVPVYMVVDLVWHHGVDEAVGTWDLTRGEVLTACWYAAATNVVSLWGRGGLKTRHREPWRARWRDWAQTAHPELWRSTADYAAVPDPPTKEAS